MANGLAMAAYCADICRGQMLLCQERVDALRGQFDLDWAQIAQRFHIIYEQHYTYRLDAPLEIVGFHLVAIAGISAAGRGRRTYRGQRVDSILSVWGSSWLVTAVGLFAVIRIHPWYEPQYAIPALALALWMILFARPLSVMVGLSKGLGAPVGSVLCGTAELIAPARRSAVWRSGR